MTAAVPGPVWRGYRPVPHRPWSTVFLVAHAVVGGLGLLAVGGAALVVGLTLLNQPGPGYEGINEPYGLVIGAVLVVVGVPLAVAQAVLVVLATSGRRAADAGRTGQLTGVAVASLGLAALGLMVWVTAGGLAGLVAGVPVFGVYAVPGVGLLLGMRSG